MKTLLIAALGLACFGNAWADSFKFGQPVVYPIGSSPGSVAVGDVTGDGRDDVIVTTNGYFDPEDDYHVFVYTQQANGTLSAPAKYRYGDYTNSSAVALADLNKDGVQDIVVGHLGGLTLLIANGSGGFSTRQAQSDLDVTNVAVMDIDLDGKTDVVGQSWYRGATLFFGDGSGGIKATSLLPTGANGYNDLEIGDVTGDGFPDLVLVSGQSFDFYVYPHNGVNGFGAGRPYPKPNLQASNSAVTILDFNQDGRNDVVVAAFANHPNSQLWLYAQTASGQLQSPLPLATTYDVVMSLNAVDLDKDGRRDLLVGHAGNRIGRYMQNAGGLRAETSTRVPSNNILTSGLATGDLNGDGCIDAAIANNSLAAMVVVPGCPQQVPIGKDINGDHRSDLLWRRGESVGYWLMNGAQVTATGVSGSGDAGFKIVAGGDYDGDGRVDLAWSNGHQLKFWINNGDGSYTSSSVTYYGSDWQPFASVDLDSDGNDDLLWRQGSHVAHWLMDGPYVRASRYTGDGGAGFKIVAAGDFNDDGASDLALASGNLLKIWMNRGDVSFLRGSAIAFGGGWEPFSASDIDGDGKSDLLWRQGSALAYWIMDGASVRRSAYAGDAGAGFSLVASGDYNGDGAGDLIFSSGNQARAWVNNGNGFNITSWYYGDGWQPFDPQIPTY